MAVQTDQSRRLSLTAQAACEPVPFSISSQLRRELRQVVDAERLLDRGNPNDDCLESIFSKQLMLFLLEVFPERRELLLRHDLTQRREQDGVLTRLVRRVHADELTERVAHARGRLRILQRRCRRL